jgi:hypothetical protein
LPVAGEIQKTDSGFPMYRVRTPENTDFRARKRIDPDRRGGGAAWLVAHGPTGPPGPEYGFRSEEPDGEHARVQSGPSIGQIAARSTLGDATSITWGAGSKETPLQGEAPAGSKEKPLQGAHTLQQDSERMQEAPAGSKETPHPASAGGATRRAGGEPRARAPRGAIECWAPPCLSPTQNVPPFPQSVSKLVERVRTPGSDGDYSRAALQRRRADQAREMVGGAGGRAGSTRTGPRPRPGRRA